MQGNSRGARCDAARRLLHNDQLTADMRARQDGAATHGRAAQGAVEGSANEWLKAEQLGERYWLYIVTDALTEPDLGVIRDPASRLPREEVVPHVRYSISQQGWRGVAERPADYGTG